MVPPPLGADGEEFYHGYLIDVVGCLDRVNLVGAMKAEQQMSCSNSEMTKTIER